MLVDTTTLLPAMQVEPSLNAQPVITAPLDPSSKRNANQVRIKTFQDPLNARNAQLVTTACRVVWLLQLFVMELS